MAAGLERSPAAVHVDMKIRLAEAEDIPQLLELSRRFLETSRFGALIAFDAPTLEGFIAGLLEQGAGFVADLDGVLVGMIGLVSFPHPFSNQMVAEEVAWFVDPDHRSGSAGPRLLTAGLEWARGRHCDMIRCSAPFGSDVGPFYERRGFTPVDTTFVKVLT